MVRFKETLLLPTHLATRREYAIGGEQGDDADKSLAPPNATKATQSALLAT